MKRLITLIKGWFFKLLGQAEQANPEALLEAEVEEIKTNIARFNEAQVQLRSRIIQQKQALVSQETKLQKLDEKVRALLQLKQEELAANAALEAQQTKEGIIQTKSLVTSLEAQYEDLKVRKEIAVAEANNKVAKMRGKLGELQLRKVQAEMNELTRSLTSSELSSGGLDRLDAIFDKQIADATAGEEISQDQIDPTLTPEYRALQAKKALDLYRNS
jgi:phage shock protein A